jgi:hypothetical protein
MKPQNAGPTWQSTVMQLFAGVLIKNRSNRTNKKKKRKKKK